MFQVRKHRGLNCFLDPGEYIVIGMAFNHWISGYIGQTRGSASGKNLQLYCRKTTRLLRCKMLNRNYGEKNLAKLFNKSGCKMKKMNPKGVKAKKNLVIVGQIFKKC